MNQMVAADGLPLWDTFEAGLFFIAGTSLGLVFGFLFPSLWRGFRRRFRIVGHLAATDEEFETIPIGTPFQQEDDDAPQSFPIEVEAQLVHARALFQAGHLRRAINAYLHLLRSSAVSSQQTARLYSELCQTYAALGLLDRALAVSREYQSRRRRSAFALRLRTELALRAEKPREHLQALRSFQGLLKPHEAMGYCHQLCEEVEQMIRTPEPKAEHLRFIADALKQAKRLAPESLRVRHTQALASFSEALNQSGQETDKLWVTFFAEIQKRIRLKRERGLPLAPAVRPLVELLELISVVDSPQEGFDLAFVQIDLIRSSFGEPERLLWQDLGELCLFQLFEQEHFHSDNKLHATLGLAFPAASDKWAAELSVKLDSQKKINPKNRDEKIDFDCRQALGLAMQIQRCAQCGHGHLGFRWKCHSCGFFESLQPTLEREKATV